MTPAQLKALKDQQDAVEAYVRGGPQKYGSTGNLVPEDLGASAMGNISTDPAYKDHELAALQELENESKTGMTAQDRADMAQTENSANRANRGRIGAIQQSMQARGAGGTGMDLVAQMQSSQDANEMEAMKALEHEGMAQDRKAQATRDLGSMSSNLQSRDFAQQQAKAQAADQIAQFNNQNRNNAARGNLANTQSIANQNVDTSNTFAGNAMNARTGLATTNYNAATEDENRRLLAEQQKKAADAARKKALGTGIGTAIGAVGGGIFGGPAGAAVGASAGGALGGAAAGMAHGGMVPGHAAHPGDDPRNDTVPTNLSPGEEVIPRSKVDAIGDLLDAVARLHKSKG